MSSPHTDPAVPLSKHAAARLQQRGIPAWFIDLLVTHARPRHDGHGAVLFTVSKATRRKLQNVLTRAEYADAERWFGVYAVVAGDDTVITAAHRTHRRWH